MSADGFAGRKRPFSSIAPVDDDDAGAHGEPSAAELLAAAEAAAGEVPALDAAGVRRTLTALERAATANALARAKHAGVPTKFFESEMALDGALARARALAATPDLYPLIIAGVRRRRGARRVFGAAATAP